MENNRINCYYALTIQLSYTNKSLLHFRSNATDLFTNANPAKIFAMNLANKNNYKPLTSNKCTSATYNNTHCDTFASVTHARA